jgi:hypothetical protein
MKRPLGRPLIEVLLDEKPVKLRENENVEDASEEDVESGLGFILDNAGTLDTNSGEEYRISNVRSFADVGMMSNNRGLTFRVGNREFSLTIQAR